MNKTETDLMNFNQKVKGGNEPLFRSFCVKQISIRDRERRIEKFKKWCFDNPSYIGKGCCDDCTHFVDPEQYGGCSGPPLDRNELCGPGYQQFEINYPRDDSIYPCDYE